MQAVSVKVVDVETAGLKERCSLEAGVQAGRNASEKLGGLSRGRGEAVVSARDEGDREVPGQKIGGAVPL
jgi:hypothetical protein